MRGPVHVVGGGIAGLTAAITAAEGGAHVVLHESAARLGGRARGDHARPSITPGPHVLLSGGSLDRWLAARQISVPTRGAPLSNRYRILDDAGLRSAGRELPALLVALARREAPAEESFRDWAERCFGSSLAGRACQLAGLFTYHHDPGTLSARFVWERYRRVLLRPDRVRWVEGGWSTLVYALARRASDLGVRFELGQPVSASELPDAPTVVATRLEVAARLLGRPLAWTGARTALLDMVAVPRQGWPSIVLDVRSDLATCALVGAVPGLGEATLGKGGALFQGQVGVPPGELADDAVERVESVLDRAMPGWREAATWRRAQVVAGSTGAVDLPGSTWRDRPRVHQGDGLYLAGDMVAAPGLLSEVSVNSGVQAGHLAVEDWRGRSFAVGWPTVTLSAERRLAILAAALPGATLSSRAGEAPFEPVDERGPGYALRSRRGRVRGAASTPDGGVVVLKARLGSGVRDGAAPLRRV